MYQNQELYSQFLGWLSIGHSPETVQSYRWGLKIFMDWAESRDILDFKERDFTEYALYLREGRIVKNTTMASYMGSLRTFWHYLNKQSLSSYDWQEIPTPKADDKVHYPFALEQEIKLIINSFDEFNPMDLRDKTILSFLWDTGVRIGEMGAIDVSQIDLEKRKAEIKTFKRTNHQREVYWSEETNQLLKKWIDARQHLIMISKYKSNALFISISTSHGGCRIRKSAVEIMMKKRRELLGINKKITPHSLRHGFGSRAVKQNVHPRHLQLMLGHAKLNTTMFYMGVENKEVEKIYRAKMI